jgi:FkbM family methyltransferase
LTLNYKIKNILKLLFPQLFVALKKFYYNQESNIKFYDGNLYKVPVRLRKIIEPWQNTPSLIEESTYVYDSYRGGDFIDVGAYLGFYSFLLLPKSHEGDNYVIIEPDKKIQSTILENLSVAVKLFPKVNFYFIPNPIGKHLVKSNLINSDNFHPTFSNIDESFNSSNLVKFRSLSIDSLCDSMGLKPTLIKIDVEGAEVNVLEGMIETIKKFKPDIMLEKHPHILRNKEKDLNYIDNFFTNNSYKSNKVQKFTSDKNCIREYLTFSN